MNKYSLEAAIVIDVSPEHIFAIYCRVDQWAEWDPETQSAFVEQPLVSGAKGWLKPRQGLKVRMRLTDLVPDKEVNFVCPVLGSKMYFEHVIERLAEQQVRVIHRIYFEGWLASWLYRQVGLKVRATMPNTLARLKAYAEHRKR